MSSSTTHADKITYAESKNLSRDRDPKIRKALARHPDTQPEFLYFLASDEEAEVRREIARNDRTPRQADLILARDKDVDVRQQLAEKIARLTPEMSKGERDKVYDLTVEILDILVKDQAVRVRGIIADTLKSNVDAPHDVIQRLARDSELSVCAPVLKFSPVLTDEDLLDIIATHKTAGTRTAISEREGLSAVLSDAIYDSGDIAATTALLANKSAQIREETLDRIIAEAPKRGSWHPPLVRRPFLPAQLAAKVASFVSDTLLSEFRKRVDFDDATMDAIEKSVQKRLKDDPKNTDKQAKKSKSKKTPKRKNSKAKKAEDEDGETTHRRNQPDDPDWAKEPKQRKKPDEKPEPKGLSNDKVNGKEEEEDDRPDRAKVLFDKGKLDEDSVWEAMASGDRRFVISALTLKAGLDDKTVPRAFSIRSPKGLTALVWKSGFSAKLATAIQTQMAGIPPGSVLRPTADGEYALDSSSLDWQVEFLSSMET